MTDEPEESQYESNSKAWWETEPVTGRRFQVFLVASIVVTAGIVAVVLRQRKKERNDVVEEAEHRVELGHTSNPNVWRKAFRMATKVLHRIKKSEDFRPVVKQLEEEGGND